MLLPCVLREFSRCSTLSMHCTRTLRLQQQLQPSDRGLHTRAQEFIVQRIGLRWKPQTRGIKNRHNKRTSQEDEWKTKNKTVLTYIAAAGVGMIGISYASVPLYRLYCQVGINPHVHQNTGENTCLTSHSLGHSHSRCFFW